MNQATIEINNVIALFFVRYPIVGWILTLVLGTTGSLIPFMEIQVPVIYMQIAQLTFWTLGAIVSILTIRGLLNKKKDHDVK
jgi:hypothetical protein